MLSATRRTAVLFIGSILGHALLTVLFMALLMLTIRFGNIQIVQPLRLFLAVLVLSAFVRKFATSGNSAQRRTKEFVRFSAMSLALFLLLIAPLFGSREIESALLWSSIAAVTIAFVMLAARMKA